MEWWGWLLIALVVIVVVGLALMFAKRKKMGPFTGGGDIRDKTYRRTDAAGNQYVLIMNNHLGSNGEPGYMGIAGQGRLLCLIQHNNAESVSEILTDYWEEKYGASVGWVGAQISLHGNAQAFEFAHLNAPIPAGGSLTAGVMPTQIVIRDVSPAQDGSRISVDFLVGGVLAPPTWYYDET